MLAYARRVLCSPGHREITGPLHMAARGEGLDPHRGETRQRLATVPVYYEIYGPGSRAPLYCLTAERAVSMLAAAGQHAEHCDCADCAAVRS